MVKFFDDLMKLDLLVDEALFSRNGNRVRQIASVVANAYRGNSRELTHYFAGDGPVAGIATTAYYLLTNEISPMQETRFGGLGAVLENTPEGLLFTGDQLWFSRNSGEALRYAVLKDRALRNSRNSGEALMGCKSEGISLWYSENREKALRDSQNTDHSLWFSQNTDYALTNSQNLWECLAHSINTGCALNGARISEAVLFWSKNTESVLQGIRRSSLNRFLINLDKPFRVCS